MIPVADLRAHLRVTGSSQDDYLEALEAGAVAYAQRRLGFFLGLEEARTEYIEGSGTERLWLSDTPVAGIDSVTERVVPGSDGSEIDPDSGDGFLVRGRKLVRKGGLVWVRTYEYEVTYTRGYESLDDPSPSNLPPSDVQQIVKLLVSHWYERRQPVPRIGEVHTFPVPHHLDSLIHAARRGRV